MPRFAACAATLFVLLLTVAGTGVAATASEFYLSLLRRGIASYEAGRFEAAARELDLAAFGLVESIDHFEVAKVYAALANDKRGRAAEARVAAQRVLAAERVQRRFAQLSLPSEVRAAFIALVKRLLSPAEVETFTSNAPVPAVSQVQPRVTPPATSNRPPPTTTPPATTTQPPVSMPQQQPQIQTPPATAPVVPTPTPQKTEPAPQKQVVVPEPAKPEPTKPEPAPPVVEPPKVIEQRTIPFPPEPAPQPKVETPQTSQAPQTSRPAPADVASRLTAAERHLANNELLDARAIYRELIETSLDRTRLLAVAEGSYRARDFATTVRAFDRVGALSKGEEPYRYYLAVALYETGDYRRAKRELAAALPFIEITDSVARYRAKIEGSIN